MAPAVALRAQLALERGRLGQALGDAEQAIRRSREDPRGWCVRGRVRLERGETDEAVADLRRAADLSQRQDAGVPTTATSTGCKAMGRSSWRGYQSMRLPQ